MRVLICGGRSFDDYRRLEAELDALHAQYRFSLVIHGGARGADSFAGHWAFSRHIDVMKVPAQWKRYGNRKAGPIRNAEMLTKEPELVIAFSGGNGTADMVRKAVAANVPVIELP